MDKLTVDECQIAFDNWWRRRNFDKTYDTDIYAAEQGWRAAWDYRNKESGADILGATPESIAAHEKRVREIISRGNQTKTSGVENAE